MKIGIFDSGLGGLIVAKEIFKALPNYDFVYYGDTKNLPYGEKSQKQIYKLTAHALTKLFKLDCRIVVIACNTASAKALRKIQKEFLPKHYPDRKVLGVIVPTIESVINHGAKIERIGILCTTSTAKSHSYKKEITKLNSKFKVFEQAAPKLVSIIENDTLELANNTVNEYTKKLLKNKIDVLILGCTHYPILKNAIKQVVGHGIKIFSQEEIIPSKLKQYLKNHPEINRVLTKNSKRYFLVTKVTKTFQTVANRLFGSHIDLKTIGIKIL